MNNPLLRKRFLSFPFLLLVLWGGVRGDDGVRREGNRVYFTPACPIIAQNFNNPADVNGATSDPDPTGWYLNASKVPNATYFAIKSHRIKAQTLGGEGVWY